jgi:hypothetical protein
MKWVSWHMNILIPAEIKKMDAPQSGMGPDTTCASAGETKINRTGQLAAKAGAPNSKLWSRCVAGDGKIRKITLDTYTQAVTPAKRRAQSKLVRMILVRRNGRRARISPA